MSNILMLGTRKGTVIFDRVQSGWRPRPIEHAGIPVCFATRDPRDGTLWASLDHGHWGPKLSRSRDGGRTYRLGTAEGHAPAGQVDAIEIAVLDRAGSQVEHEIRAAADVDAELRNDLQPAFRVLHELGR